MQPKQFIGSAWWGGTSGLRISGLGEQGREFFRQWQSVALILDGDGQVKCNITGSWQEGCVDLRNAQIGRWFVRNGWADKQRPYWPCGEPPQFTLIQVAGNTFKVSKR